MRRERDKNLDDPLVIEFLTSRGWHSYYNENYWVNTKCITDPMSQDYTNYGMSVTEALHYELEGRSAFGPTPFASLLGSGAKLNNYGRTK